MICFTVIIKVLTRAMNRLMGVIVRRFSRLTKQEVQQSSYE